LFLTEDLDIFMPRFAAISAAIVLNERNGFSFLAPRSGQLWLKELQDAFHYLQHSRSK